MSIIVYIIAGMLAASAFLFAVSLVPSKSSVTLRLEQMEALPFTPEIGPRAAAFERVFNQEQRSNLQQMLLEAGWYSITTDKMGMRIVAGLIFGSAIAIGFGTYMEWYDEYLVLGTVALGFSGACLPYSTLRAAIRKRKVQVQRALPDLLDMLATTMQAGLAFNAALTYATDAARGPLGASCARSYQRFAWVVRGQPRCVRWRSDSACTRSPRWSRRSCRRNASARTSRTCSKSWPRTRATSGWSGRKKSLR